MKHLAALLVATAIFAIAIVRYSAERCSGPHRSRVPRSAARVSSEFAQPSPCPPAARAPIPEIRKRQISDLAREIEERSEPPAEWSGSLTPEEFTHLAESLGTTAIAIPSDEESGHEENR